MMRLLLSILLALVPLDALAYGIGFRPPARQKQRWDIVCTPTPGVGWVCSNGVKSTTTRAGAVPCETAPGVWTMVDENVPCVSWKRQVESWAATTSYLSWGAELDRSPWGSIRGGTLQPVADGWQVSNDPSQSNSGWVYMGGAADEGVTYTVACRVRAETPTTLRVSPLDAGGVDCPLHQVGAEWATVSCTQTAEAGRRERAHIWPGVEQEGPASVIVAACWLTKSDTPGRPCWGGEAPVTCAADRHTISTEGWPTESGEISLVYTPQGVGIGSAMYLVATTNGSSGSPSGIYLYRISASGALVFGLRRGATISAQVTQDLAWENGRSYHVRVRWSPERAEIFRDGVRVRSWVPTTVPDSHPDVAHIGTNTVGTSPAQGAISSLRVRSAE